MRWGIATGYTTPAESQDAGDNRGTTTPFRHYCYRLQRAITIRLETELSESAIPARLDVPFSTSSMNALAERGRVHATPSSR